MTYDKDKVMAALMRYSGTDQRLLQDVDRLSSADGVTDGEYAVITDAVARLANRVPGAGPVVALEIVAAVGRLWAERTQPR